MTDPILDAIMQKRAERQAVRISNRLRHVAKQVEKSLDAIMLPGEEKPLFALFVFTGGVAQYIGNGEREDIKRVVATVINRWDNPEYASLHQPWHEKTDEQKDEERKDAL